MFSKELIAVTELIAAGLAGCWICALLARKKPSYALACTLTVLMFSGLLVLPTFWRERSAIRGVSLSPDSRVSAATYVDTTWPWLSTWTVFVRPRWSLWFLNRGAYVFFASNLSRVEAKWESARRLTIYCDCSAGEVWEVKSQSPLFDVEMVEVPSQGSRSLPLRPRNAPDGAVRVSGKWVHCKVPVDGAAWNQCSVYSDNGALLASGPYGLRQQQRPAHPDELRYAAYETTNMWIYLKPTDDVLEPIQPLLTGKESR